MHLVFRNRWTSLFLVLMLLPVQFAVGVDGTGGGDVVARLPREGDIARYEFTGTVLGICDWGVATENRVLHRLSGDNIGMAWRVEEHRLWEDDERTWASLVTSRDSQWCDNGNGDVQTGFHESDLYGSLPGPRIAAGGHYHHIVTPTSPSYITNARDEWRPDRDGCGRYAVGRVLGQTDEDARSGLGQCLGTSDLFGSSFSAKWEDHQDYGRTWVVRFGTMDGSSGDDHGLLVRYSPLVSMPVEVLSTKHRLADGTWVEEPSHLRMTGWQDGDGRVLATALDGATPPPRLEMVGWGPNGPVTEDLEPIPVQSAREALSRTPDGAAYFQQHPGTRLHHAVLARHYGDVHTSMVATPPAPVSDRSGDGAGYNELECQQREVREDDPGLEAPDPEFHSLQVVWSDESQSLTGQVQSSGSANEVGPPSAVANADPVIGPSLDASMPSLGPSWSDLFAAEEMVKGMGGVGQLRVEVAAPGVKPLHYVGSGQMTYQMFRPGFSVGEETVWAAVSLYRCDPTDASVVGERWLKETGVAFADGELQYLWNYVDVWDYAPLAQVPRPESPTAPFDTDGSFPWILAAGGIGLAGLLAYLFRAGMGGRLAIGMFSRFHRSEVLDHPVRSQLMQVVQQKPGTRLPQLADDLRMHRAKASHHLRMLERHGHVRITRTWQGLVVHPAGHAGAATATVMARANAHDLLRLVRTRPGIDVSTAAQAIGVDKSRISRLARDLEMAGLLTRQRDGRRVRLT